MDRLGGTQVEEVLGEELRMEGGERQTGTGTEKEQNWPMAYR